MDFDHPLFCFEEVVSEATRHKTAFLCGNRSENVNFKNISTTQVKKDRDVRSTKKSVYGLRDASLVWYMLLNEKIVDFLCQKLAHEKKICLSCCGHVEHEMNEFEDSSKIFSIEEHY